MSSASKLQRALDSHRAGDFAAAERDYRRLLAKNPRDVAVLYHLGVALHQQARAEEARQILARAAAIAPDAAEIRFSLGLVAMDLGRHDEAEAALRKAASLRPDLPRALTRLGELLVLRKKFAEAEPVLGRAIQLNAGDRKAWIALSLALRERSALAEAIEANYRVLALEDKEDGHAAMADLVYLLSVRDPEAARAHARRWLDAHPGSPFARHVAAGVLGLPPPERAGDDYVKLLFDKFAASFEEQLGNLGYRTPDILGGIAELADTADRAGTLDVLDAGCGTGLAAPGLRRAAARLVGVDISPRMLDKARAKGLYDELVEMELEAFLNSRRRAFDLIVASDVFNYFGSLASVLDAAARALRPGGRLAFTLECAHEGVDGFALGAHGRYGHGRSYVLAALEEAGLQPQELQEKVLRQESGKPVNGLLVVARPPAPTFR